MKARRRSIRSTLSEDMVNCNQTDFSKDRDPTVFYQVNCTIDGLENIHVTVDVFIGGNQAPYVYNGLKIETVVLWLGEARLVANELGFTNLNEPFTVSFENEKLATVDDAAGWVETNNER